MKKILFNDKFGLTKAVLEGRKTMTRRIIPNRVEVKESGYNACGFCDEDDRDVKPAYKVGDVVSIAQSYESIGRKDIAWEYQVNDDGSAIESVMLPGWKNKMFVRSEYMPWAIKITDVRVERLQDISEEDCSKEGVIKLPYTTGDENTYYSYWNGISNEPRHKSKPPFTFTMNSGKITQFAISELDAARKVFQDIIDGVSGKGTWDSNPWVFVYEFEVIPNPNNHK